MSATAQMNGSRQATVPHNTQAEEIVVGCLMLAPVEVLPLVSPILVERDFFDGDIGGLYAVLANLIEAGKPVINTPWLQSELPRHGVTDATMARMSKIARELPHHGHAVYHAEQVREASDHRQLLLAAQETVQQVAAGLPAEDIRGMLTYYLERQRARDTGFAANGFELLTCLDVANAPEQEYLAKGLIPRLQPGVIGAPYKGMKTSICCDIAASLATGGYCLGFFRVPKPVKVLFMSAESGLPTLRKTTEAICHAAGIRWPDDLENLQWCTSLPRLGIDDDLRKLDAAFKTFPFEVLIADPLFKMCGGDGAENVMKQGEKFMHLQRWCDAHGVTLIFVHHLTKPASRIYDPAELGDLSYAGIAEHVRWWILLSRQEKYLPPDPVHRLWFSAGGSAGHSGLWACSIDLGEYIEGQPRQWNVTMQEAQEVRQEAAEKKAAAKNQAKADAAKGKAMANVKTLLDVLRAYPAGETKSVLKTAAGMNTDTINTALSDAMKSKQVEACTVFKGGRKQGREGYRLTNSQASGPSGPSGQNGDLSDCPNAEDHPDGLPLLKEGSPSPDASVQSPDDSEQTIRTEEAAA